jgi:hypothetical protein
LTDWNKVTEKYLELKKKNESDVLTDFDKVLKKPFQQAKILKSQYNSLISEKPYSFVANMMGHKPLI